MRTFCLFIVLLLLAVTVVTAAQQKTPSRHGHHGGRRRNAAKYFGYVRKNGTSYLKDQNELAKEFIHAHNWVRTQYKLPALKWDESLASFARKYLMQRYGDCQMIHSTSNYGENMFWGKKLHWTPSDSVYYWYQEKKWFNFSSLNCQPKQSCEHFTQIVWRDSQRIGCALQHCQNPKNGMLIVCEYDPPGNFEKENPLQAHSN